MSNARRISITVYSALAPAVTLIGWQLSDGGLWPNPWLVSFFVAAGLAVVGAFVVYRWWALIPAFTTVGALWLGAAIDHAMQHGSFEVPIPPEYVDLFTIVPLGISIAALSVGLLARAIWEYLIRPNLPARTDSKEAVR